MKTFGQFVLYVSYVQQPGDAVRLGMISQEKVETFLESGKYKQTKYLGGGSDGFVLRFETEKSGSIPSSVQVKFYNRRETQQKDQGQISAMNNEREKLEEFSRIKNIIQRRGFESVSTTHPFDSWVPWVSRNHDENRSGGWLNLDFSFVSSILPSILLSKGPKEEEDENNYVVGKVKKFCEELWDQEQKELERVNRYDNPYPSSSSSSQASRTSIQRIKKARSDRLQIYQHLRNDELYYCKMMIMDCHTADLQTYRKDKKKQLENIDKYELMPVQGEHSRQWRTNRSTYPAMLDEHQLNTEKMLDDVQQALEQMHQKDYIHYDVNLSNIVYKMEEKNESSGKQMTATLINFGGCKKISDFDYNRPHKSQDDLDYLIPSEDLEDMDARYSDMYALGVSMQLIYIAPLDKGRAERIFKEKQWSEMEKEINRWMQVNYMTTEFGNKLKYLLNGCNEKYKKEKM